MKTLINATALSLLSACASTLPQIPDEQALQSKKSPLKTEHSAQLMPLPGTFNHIPVFYSNRPELLKTPGEILNSADLSGESELKGSFSVFAHHVVETAPFDFSGFRLGLLVRPAAKKTVTLNLHKAFIARTQPDAPFISTPSVWVQSKTDKMISGPGDAMAWARLHDQNNYPKDALLARTLPAVFTFNQEILVADIEVPTFPLGLGIIGERNAMSAWLDMSSTAPVEMRWVALKTSASGNASVTDYQSAAQAKAGPAELPATVYDPKAKPPSGVFRFGRVAGIAQGTEWKGEYTLSDEAIESLQQGKRLAWPVATTYLKAWAGQNQSAPLLARDIHSAVESHGNYGLAYRMTYTLSNPTQSPLKLDWRWTQPTAVTPQNTLTNTLTYAPQSQIVFRGSIRVEEQCQNQDGLTKMDADPPDIKVYHLQTQQGHWHMPFYEQNLLPGHQCRLLFEWVYPPDAIPPQVLSVEKKP